MTARAPSSTLLSLSQIRLTAKVVDKELTVRFFLLLGASDDPDRIESGLAAGAGGCPNPGREREEEGCGGEAGGTAGGLPLDAGGGPLAHLLLKGGGSPKKPSNPFVR